MSNLVALALAFAALCCTCRLAFLRLLLTYPALLCFFVLQFVTAGAWNVPNRQTWAYEYIYVAMLMLEWIVYGLMLREIYAAIFSNFPGIAVLGRWSIYAASVATACIGALSFAMAKETQEGNRFLLDIVEFTAHNLMFGFVTLILIILAAISRCPLRLHKNVLINSGLFSAILLAEAAGLIVDRFTRHDYTGWLNIAVSVVVLVCLTAWPILLTREGQTIIVKFRRDLNLADEKRLLSQLSAINSILLRAARK